MKRSFFDKVRHRLSFTLTLMGQKILPPPPVGQNLLGDRDIEWSWILARIPSGPGEALDLGPGHSLLLSLTAAQKGFKVLALDRERYLHHFVAKSITIKRNDILAEKFPESFFDLILCCSTIEHIGLPERYGVQRSFEDGDLATMRNLLFASKPDGIMLLTIPVGLDAVCIPNHRIYGMVRLPKLLEGWWVEEESYWVKQTDDRWHNVSRQEALLSHGSKHHYGLGCYILKKGSE
jgi:SAM-dependent methyltransferase